MTVANITFNHSSFATKESNMVMYSDDIYEEWINILEKYQASTARGGRQPSITTFSCLRGLEEVDVKLLQQELIEGKICLVKQTSQGDMLDLSTRATNLKLTKPSLHGMNVSLIIKLQMRYTHLSSPVVSNGYISSCTKQRRHQQFQKLPRGMCNGSFHKIMVHPECSLAYHGP